MRKTLDFQSKKSVINSSQRKIKGDVEKNIKTQTSICYIKKESNTAKKVLLLKFKLQEFVYPVGIQ